MVPSECTHLLYDVFGRRLAAHMHADQDYVGDDLGKCLYPGLVEARRSTLCFIQEEGETLFVPSGWHHTVENMEPTLSINHNWVNGTNILSSWDRVMGESMNEHVQRNYSTKIESNVELQSNEDTASVEKNGKVSQEVGQVDDLQLLWLIISKKAKAILNENKKCPIHIFDTDSKVGLAPVGTSTYNLKKVLHILEDMQILLERCSVHIGSRSINSNIDARDIHDLITEINIHFNGLDIKP